MNETSLNVRGIAHDLNNQIMILMNALDRVMILCPGEPDAHSALKAAERCASLTSKLLPPNALRVPTPGASIREIVSEAAMLARPLLPSYNRIDVVCHVESTIAAPAHQIQQALVNLCINASEAMDGPGVIEIAVEHFGDTLVLSVSDTGPGVPAELREQIFEPFFTTKSTSAGGSEDFGLGLFRVRETVEQNGGLISVSNVFPHGACFRIELPVAVSCAVS